MTSPATAYDLITMGRLGIDLYPEQVGVGLQEVTSFGKSLGGTAANVAVAAARHGRSTALVSRTGNDPFGRYLRHELRRLGVDDAFVGVDPELLTPITFCEIFPPDNFPLYFYRKPAAPDMAVTADDLDLDAISRARIFWATGSGLSEEPSRSAIHAAWQARARADHTILDLDYRPMFWSSPEEAHLQVDAALEHVTIAVGNREECGVAVRESDPERAADALLAHGVELAVVKLGPDGVLAKTADSRVQVPAFPVGVVNGLGAGDGFGGALCHALLADWDLERAIRFANAAGGIVASRRECSTAMPTSAEVEDVLLSAGSGR